MSETQVGNNNGGPSFKIDKWEVLNRFLMIGSENGNYYASAKEVNDLGMENVLACIKEDGALVVRTAQIYSVSGRAPKNEPSLQVLAMVAAKGSPDHQELAYLALPQVARTGTHLFKFVETLNRHGKWNAAAKRGIAKWYIDRPTDKLAIQMLKYQSRNGWSHRDVLRLAHVKPQQEHQAAMFKYAVSGKFDSVKPGLLEVFENLQKTGNPKEVARIIEENSELSWEMIPTQFLSERVVLEALLPNMGITAIIRQLGKLSAYGVISDNSEGSKIVQSKLNNPQLIRNGRVHPLTILQATKQYDAGHGLKGKLKWRADASVLTALDTAFYSAFQESEETDQKYFIGVDISGSMQNSIVTGAPNLVASEVAAVMAMVVARSQTDYFIGGFDTTFRELRVSPSMTLQETLKAVRKYAWHGGGTDCAQAFEYARKNKIDVDKFVTITDNETCDRRHGPPVNALRRYRLAVNEQAKSIVLATSLSEFTIADPDDAGMLDIAGFDSAAAQIISAF